MADIKSALKANLPVLRNIFDLSVEDVTKKIGCENYPLVEKGEMEPSVNCVIALADLYDISMDQIVRKPLTTFVFNTALSGFKCVDGTRLASRHE